MPCRSSFAGPVACFVLVAAAGRHAAGEWPTYRHDNARSGITEERLALPLRKQWTFRPLHRPVPSWPDPKRERARVFFDDAFHVAVSGGHVFFGSSADCTVYALDCRTGAVVWTYHTGGAVRFTPVVWSQRVYVVSDDGFVYCLALTDGKPLWRRRAALSDRHVLGHERVISVQPPRAGVVVDRGMAYFACGIFPTEGAGLFCVDALTGEPVWSNTTFGYTYQAMAHGGTEGFSGVSPQGYMLASPERLFVVCGRSVPASFDREDGRFVFWHGSTQHEGGTRAVLADGVLYSDADRLLPPNAAARYYDDPKGVPAADGTRLFYDSPRLIARDTATGRDRFVACPGDRIVVAKETSYIQNNGVITALDRHAYAELGARENAIAGKLMSNFWRNYRGSLDIRVLEQRRRGLTAKGGDLSEDDQASLSKAREAVVPGNAERDRLEADMRGVKEDISQLFRWRRDTGLRHEIILAGDVLYAGGDGGVGAVDASTGETIWQGAVGGAARGLAVGCGYLIVSTDDGSVTCFGPGEVAAPVEVTQKAAPVPPLAPSDAVGLGRLVEAILRQDVPKRGLCLVYGCRDGRLMLELLRRTDLRVVGYDPDPACVETARSLLWRAGLLGHRADVFAADLSRLPCSDYAASLLVSESMAGLGRTVGTAREVCRVLRPCGGVAFLGQPTGAAGPVLQAAKLSEWAGPGDWELLDAGGRWARLVRGPLPGAADWTHQYAEPGNGGCSGDELVRAPFQLLWYGRPGMAKVIDRHHRAAAPLYANGRLYHQGINCLFGIDAYSGFMLWERDVPGAMRDGLSGTSGNMCASQEGLFVATGETCLEIDGASGATLRRHAAPTIGGDKRRWGWLALDGDLLFGSCQREPGLSDAVFAMGPGSGTVAWLHEARSIRNCTLAMSVGRVFFLDSGVSPAETDAVRQAGGVSVLEDPRPDVPLPGQPYYPAGKTRADIRALVALDARTGERQWRRPVDLTGMGKEPSLIVSNAVVLAFANMDATRIAAFSAESGIPLWSKKTVYFRRPAVIDGVVYTLPYAHDLRTGALKARANPITGEEAPWVWTKAYGCGAVSASRHTMFFRSGSLAYLDVSADAGLGNLGGLKPSCWISQIAAGGVWLAPEGSAGCSCGYPIRSTVAMAPAPPETEHWTHYVKGIAVTPVVHLALNFGAPGDRRDASGRLWFGWPRPRSRLGLTLPVKVDLAEGGEYFDRGRSWVSAAAGQRQWIYRCGSRGLARCEVRLTDDEGVRHRYTVRLHLARTPGTARGEPIGRMALEGRFVEPAVDLARAVSGPGQSAVREYRDMAAGTVLTLEVSGQAADTAIAGMEILRQ